MHPSIWREVWILAGIAVASLIVGLITDRPFIVAAIGFGLYIATMLRHLQDLHRWLLTKRLEDVPDAGGLWGAVFDNIRALLKESGRREDRLTGMLGRFQDASAATPDGMLILSLRDKIEWANPAAERLLGIAYPRDFGVRIVNLVRDPEFVDYLEKGAYIDALDLISPEQPERHVSVRIIPFGSSQKLVIARDTSRLVQLEEMRRNFVANISHELRTPLTVLTGFVETLKDMKEFQSEDLKRHFGTMYEQAVRMKNLVDDLLTLSRLETSPPSRRETLVDVPAMLASLKETAEILSGERRHRITLDADPRLKLRGNEEELRSAFSNLINNAVRYTPAGGAIGLRWWANAEGGKFAVTDTGDGIAPQHIPHLTERFYRVDTARSRNTGGTGLGLSIVKHILLRHDARLTIESELGKGSTFTCAFPAPRVEQRPAGGEPVRAPPGDHS